MNDALKLLAEVVDLLTCGNLHYAEPRGGQPSRAYAAAKLVDDDHVQYTGTPGVWLVRSRSIRKNGTEGEPVWYRVLVDGTDLHCECQDDQYRGTETRHEMICAHKIAAADREAMRRVWEGEKEE